jgi:hypothetical protein
MPGFAHFLASVFHKNKKGGSCAVDYHHTSNEDPVTGLVAGRQRIQAFSRLKMLTDYPDADSMPKLAGTSIEPIVARGLPIWLLKTRK